MPIPNPAAVAATVEQAELVLTCAVLGREADQRLADGRKLEAAVLSQAARLVSESFTREALA